MSDFIKLTTRIRRVNAQILAAERKYGKDSKIVQRVYHYLNLGQGTEGLTRYRTPKGDASLAQLAKLDRALTAAENSAYLSKEGRKKILENARATFSSSLDDYGYDLSEKEVVNLYDTFLSVKNVASEITSRESWQVIDEITEAMQDEGLTKRQIVNIAKDYYNVELRKQGGTDLTLADYIRLKGRQNDEE